MHSTMKNVLFLDALYIIGTLTTVCILVLFAHLGFLKGSRMNWRGRQCTPNRKVCPETLEELSRFRIIISTSIQYVLHRFTVWSLSELCQNAFRRI